MKNYKLRLFGVAAGAVIGLVLCGSVLADTVLLKDGRVIEGQVVDKRDVWLVMIPQDANGMKMFYKSEDISKVNGRKFSAFRLPRTAALKIPSGQPVIVVTLKDGRTVKGKLVERNGQFLRLTPEGSGRYQEFLVEDIVKAE